MDRLLDKTEVELPIANSLWMIMILFGSLMLNFCLFINCFVNLSFVLTIYIKLPFVIFRFDCLKDFYLCLDLAYSSSIFNLSCWILPNCLFLRNSASDKTLPFSDFLVKLSSYLMICWWINLMMTFSWKNAEKLHFLIWNDNRPFLSCSASLI